MVLLVCLRNVAASDAPEQVGVAVGSSAAVAELPDARPELHGAAVAHPALRHRGHVTDGHFSTETFIWSTRPSTPWRSARV